MSDDMKALVPASPARAFNLVPQSFGEARELAAMIAHSEFAPKDYRGKPENVIIAIQMGLDLGLKPMQSLQNIAVINGRPAVYGDGALAIVQARGIIERFHETVTGDGDAMVATCVIKRKDWPDEIVRTFSVADAKKAGLWGKSGPWTTYPKRMLQMRSRGFALRDAAADCLMGIILAEEAQDIAAIDSREVVESDAPPVDPLEGVDAEVRASIEKGFETLHMNPAQRLMKCHEFFAREGFERAQSALDLQAWLKDEYARRKFGKPLAPKETGDNGRKTQKKATAAASPQDVVDAEVIEDAKGDQPAASRTPVSAEPVSAPAADEIF